MKKSKIKLIGSFAIMMCIAVGIIFASTNSKASTKSVVYNKEYSVDNGIPTLEGYLFGGYYVDDENEADGKIPITSIEGREQGTYYAKFVPKEVLDIQAQVSENIVNDKNTDIKDNNKIRFVTSIDSTEYKMIGFEIQKGPDAEAKMVETKPYVYSTLYYIGSTGAESDILSTDAGEVFYEGVSKYFKTYTLTNVPENVFNTDITVRPYWITLDGTTVYGTKAIKTVNLGRAWIYVDSEATNSTQLGTYNAPYTTISDAVAYDTILTSKLILKSDMTVDTPVAIDKSVTLTSENGAELTRAENLTGNMFDVTAGTFTIQGSEGKEVVIDGNIDITAEDATAVDARAVYVEADATFNMTNGVIQNFYSSADYDGAALSLYGSFAIENSKFIDNQTDGYGGAIYVNGKNSLTIIEGMFENNQAGKQGGAIYSTGVKNEAIQLTNCTFEKNTSSSSGGAIHVGNKNKLIVKNSSFNNNTATSNYGGAIAMGTTTSEVVLEGEVTFANNTAGQSNYGGGAVMTGSGFTIAKDADVIFEKNTAGTTLGGAIYFNYNADITPTFTLAEGAELVMTDNADKNGTTDIAVKDGKAAQINLNGSYKINRIHAEVGTLITLGTNAQDLNSENLTMVHLDGTAEEGMQLVTGSTEADTIFTALASPVATLNADGSLGGIGKAATLLHEESSTDYASLSEALGNAVDGDIIKLTASTVLDAPLTITQSVTITTDDTSRIISFPTTISNFPITVDANGKEVVFEGTSANAELIFVGTGEVGCSYSILNLYQATKVTMEYVNIQYANRKSTDGGGAIYSTVPLTMTNCDFTNCKATASGKNGGAVLMKSATLTAANCTLSNCQATNQGGAIYNSGKNVGTVNLIGCTFIQNVASKGGGAVYIGSENTMTINGCTFIGNSDDTYGGAVGMGTATSILNFEGTCMFEGNTVTGNGTHFGGAVFAPRNLCIKKDAVVKMTGNKCTNYNCGDAISINGTTSNTKFTIESGAALYVWDNPDAEDSDNDICLKTVSPSTTGASVEPTVSEGGVYSTSAPEN